MHQNSTIVTNLESNPGSTKDSTKFDGASNSTHLGDLPVFPAVESANELQKIDIPPPAEPVPGIIRAGLNILAAGKGVGKSYFALALGVGIAETGSVFDHESKGGGIEVKTGSVLYIANESDRAEMQDRLEVLTDLDEWPERLQIAYGSKRLDEGLLDDLEAWLKSHPDARLVIIDILANVRTQTRRSGNPYHADIQDMTPLHKLALKYGVAILAVSHTKKGDAEDWTHAFMGWEAGAAAVCLKLERKFGETEGSLELQGRGLPPSKWKLEFDSGVWSITGKGEEFFASEASQQVIAILQEAEEPVHYTAIATALGKSVPATKVLLGRMVKKRLITRTGGGYYGLVTSEKKANTVTTVTDVT